MNCLSVCAWYWYHKKSNRPNRLNGTKEGKWNWILFLNSFGCCFFFFLSFYFHSFDGEGELPRFLHLILFAPNCLKCTFEAFIYFIVAFYLMELFACVRVWLFCISVDMHRIGAHKSAQYCCVCKSTQKLEFRMKPWIGIFFIVSKLVDSWYYKLKMIKQQHVHTHKIISILR